MSANPADSLTPMVRQYSRIKAQYPDTILMFRLGDFYEMFNEDAHTASRVLEITLTKKHIGDGRTMPLAGIPYHALDRYLAVFLRAGYRVAICEQLEDPKKAKGVVRRDVVRVVTPGTLTESSILDEKTNNYLAAVTGGGKTPWGLAYVDLSTGRLVVGEFDARRGTEELAIELMTLQPAEVLVPDRLHETVRGLLDPQHPAALTVRPDEAFHPAEGRKRLLAQLGTTGLDGFGAGHMVEALGAAGALLLYLEETQKTVLSHLRSLEVHSPADVMLLDYTTQRGLELLETFHGGNKTGTLLSILDRTLTGMGARLLRRWMVRPLRTREAIERRLEAVENLVQDFTARDAVGKALRGLHDLERIMGRVGCRSANARDLVCLRLSLERLPLIQQGLSAAQAPLLREIAAQIDPLPQLRDLLQRALVDDPPYTLREGGLIRDGYHAEVDQLRTLARDSKSWIQAMQQEEIRRTGIPKLKIGFNQVFGYYIEVTKPNLHLVPDDYIRKQTLSNCERFVTPALKEKEEIILHAEERLQELEFQLFEGLREQVAGFAVPIQELARRIAELDCLRSLAEAAIAGGYVRPTIGEDGRIEIIEGRHPVLEAIQSDPPFVPNDTHLDNDTCQIALITGPNMAGKSTYIRQVALITLMAHMGSFVPARRAAISVVDRIFTRVGAMDHLAKGQSTFLVEMSETANILHNATDRSLVILDEIGRGTSTYDGLSIAWAVLEALHNRKGRRPKTLFATHYHELVDLENHLPRLKNFNVAVLEEKERIVFLYKIVPGGTDRSYGIYAAQLAGVPAECLARAREILFDLECGNTITIKSTRHKPSRTVTDGLMQLTFFDGLTHPVLEKLRKLDVNSLTPVEALKILDELARESR
ncbi:MAG: DNA mismatch repair protein MutS [Candidatus Sumerlaeia bacterium]|nr:DNA mismatch repair protein MutS [Candidatus Sumerlaeia bacterium]